MNYQELYDSFMQKYKQTETTPAQAGEVLARIASLFPNANLAMIRAERAYAIVCKNEVEGSDELTGKAISSAKATTIAEATPEAFEFKTAKAHVTNIEFLVGSLKFLQKSLEVEYVNTNL